MKVFVEMQVASSMSTIGAKNSLTWSQLIYCALIMQILPFAPKKLEKLVQRMDFRTRERSHSFASVMQRMPKLSKI